MNSDPKNEPVKSEPFREPQARRSPVPVWLMVLTIVLMYWGLLYFDAHGGWFDQEVYAPYRSTDEVAKWQPAGGGDGTQAGRQVYNKPTCSACHQTDGKGTAGQFPPLVNSPWVQEPGPGRLIRIVLLGLNGPLELNGQAFNNSMVPWKGTLSDQEIADVLTYIRKNKAWGNDASEVTAEQVKAVEAKLGSRSAPFTPQELMKVNPAE
jgi:mono/diheme cytochrome c family protein